MAKTVLHIKNMVCPRCVMAVEQILGKLAIPFSEVKLGQAFVGVPSSEIDTKRLANELHAIGFELMQDKNTQLVEQVKTEILKYIHYSDNQPIKLKFSEYLSQKIGKDYARISLIFSEKEKIGIEKYLILQKIERVKELITYGELNFSEIAFRLNYSSVAYLSKQFKQITRLTLSEYKKKKQKDRKTLDKVKN